MWPKILNLRDKTVSDSLFTLGGQADSLYEYLPKMYALLGGREPRYAAMLKGGDRIWNRQDTAKPSAAATVASSSTDISKLSDRLQNTSLGGSSYQATDSGAEYHPVDYQAIPWTNHGDGKKTLTVRLALFYLSMRAGFGPAEIQTAYPPFNSWTCRDDGTLMHNTTGKVIKRTASPDAILCYYDPLEGSL
ncbi:hypothetical protein V8F33_006855 [Rhypophila sp. PSN 637]